MNNDLIEACKAIAEFMGRNKFIRYLISRDNGESLVIEFSTDQEATKYLCEQQTKGWMMEYGVVKKEGVYFDYAKSLDALMPVWEKLSNLNKEARLTGVSFDLDDWFQVFVRKGYNTFSVESFCEAETIQQAACLATAKAIRELKKDEKDER